MKRNRKVIAFLLAVIMVIPMFAFTAFSAISAEGGTADEIIASIPTVYAEAKKIANRSSFNGYCGAYVRCQMIALGIISKSTTGMGNGKDQFDYWKSKTVTDCNFNVTAYPASKYSILDVLNAVSNNGTKNAYNILIGFEWSNYGDGKTYGHVMFIRALINGTVYYTESSHWNIDGGIDEGHLITCSFSKFSQRYGSTNYTFDGGIHFYKADPIPYSSIKAGNYNLINKANGKYMHVQSAGDSNGQLIEAGNSAFDAKADTFYIYAADDGYEMRPACSSSRVVNAWGNKPAVGAKVTLYDDLNNSTQWWKFEAVTDGYIIHLAYNTGLVLTQKDGAVSIETRTGASNQIWKLENNIPHDLSSTLSSVKGCIGETVKLTLSIDKNTLVKSGAVSFELPNGFTIVKGEWKNSGPKYNDKGDSAINIISFITEDGNGVFTYDSSSYYVNGNIFELTVKIPESCADGVYGISYALQMTTPQRTDLSVSHNYGAIAVSRYTPGDIDGNDGLDANDAIYLLYHIYFLDSYPVNQPCDFDGDGYETSDDAIYLLYHIYFKDSYPLH